MKRKVRYECTDCGSNSLYWDNASYWDAEAQDFRASDDTGDGPFCGDCGAEHCGKTLDVDTGEELRNDPNNWGEWITVAEADAAWAAIRARNLALRQERADNEEHAKIADLLAADQAV